MEINHTKTEAINTLPDYLFPNKTKWVIFKAGEFLPNCRLVGESNLVHGFIQGAKPRIWCSGYQNGMKVPNYYFEFKDDHRGFEIVGAYNSKWIEKFQIIFKDIAERDAFIFDKLKATVGSKQL